MPDFVAMETFAPDQLVSVLQRLNRGEELAFSQQPRGPLAFTLGKIGRSFVMRNDKGQALASASTFAEIWRQRPHTERSANL